MTQPFGGARPAAVPYSGTCDASGNLTLKVRPRAAFWWSGKAITRVSAGSPVVEVTIGGLPYGFGRGQRSEVAGLMVAPGDVVSIAVINAQAGAAVTGLLNGTQGPTMEDVAGSFSPAPNTIAVDSAAIQVLLGTVVDKNNVGTSKTFTIPPGAQAIGFSWDESGANNAPVQVSVLGQPTGTGYLTVSSLSANGGLDIALLAVSDTSVSVTVLSPAASQSTVYVLAWMAFPAVFIEQVTGTSLTVQEGPSPASWQTDRPWDWSVGNQFNNGPASQANPATPAGKRPVIGGYAVRAASSAAVAYGTGITFTDSVLGLIWEDGVSIPATASAADHANLGGVAIRGSVNGTITMASGVNPGANIFIDMSFGGWFV